MVFGDRDLGTGVNEKKDARDPSLEWNRVLYLKKHMFIISSYKAALGSKKINEEKQSQANNSLERAKKAFHMLSKRGITE